MKYSLKMSSRPEYWNHDNWTAKKAKSSWQREPHPYTLTQIRFVRKYMNYHYHWHMCVEIHAIQR